MNFYKRHLGDIAKSCGDLSQGQMGAFDLLLDWHYANEKPLPAVADKLYRIGRAVTHAERANVDSVLAELFTLTEAGYIHKRAGEEMAKANAQAETNRRIAEEREAKKRATNRARNKHESFDESCTNRQPSQTPDSRLQEASPSCENNHTPPAAVGQVEGHEHPKPAASPAGALAVALNRAGVRCTSLNPDLIAYAEAGGTVDHLLQCAGLPECQGKPAAYSIRIARRELAETAAPVAASGQHGRAPVAPHNPGGVSPRLSPEEEAARKADALAGMERQLREFGHAA